MKSSTQESTSRIVTADSRQLIIADRSKRAEPFRTRTIITEEDGKKVVYKCAASEKSKTFIRELVTKERTNAAYLRGQFDVHAGTLEEDRAKYDYLPYPSLVDRMQFHMREGDFQAAQELLERYVQKIEALETTTTIPEEFLMLVANQDNYNYKCKCLCRGLLDLTPKNILLSGNRWIVLDNEWSFDFPVPIVFVLFRAIRELAIALQAEIRQITSEDTPALGVFATGLHTYYIPLVWIKYIITNDISLRRLIGWEVGFWQYTMGAEKGYVGRIKRRLPLRTHLSTRSMIFNNQVYANIKRLVRSVPGVNKVVHILDE